MSTETKQQEVSVALRVKDGNVETRFKAGDAYVIVGIPDHETPSDDHALTADLFFLAENLPVLIERAADKIEQMQYETTTTGETA